MHTDSAGTGFNRRYLVWKAVHHALQKRLRKPGEVALLQIPNLESRLLITMIIVADPNCLELSRTYKP